ncbi:MAG TPA: sulfatase-like hydrolase/transferase, partial [Vicinamibacteria bacterium]|nr:sulfatase-like hydrolase/transferase [Vicinamibacteria bacterium]
MTRALFSFWLTAALMGCGTAPKAPNRWNVLLVSVDTLRADHLSSYGATGIRTEASDRLASEGVLFEDVTTVSPTTLPAHASLFTGLTPVAHGVRDNVGFTLRGDVPTLASQLKANDYETAGFVGAFVLDSRFGIARGFDVWDDELGASADGLEAGIVAQRRGDAVLDSAFRWLDGRSEGESPFFAFVHFYDPHTPYESPGDDDRARYRGEVAYTDSLVGKLLDGIEERGLASRTLVVLTSDHGESLGQHGELTHGLFVYEATLRIPLILRFPGAPAGKRIPGLARILDVTPTILDLLGLPPLRKAGGQSLVARIEGKPLSEPVAYAETFVPRFHYGWSELRAVRRGRHKLVLAPRPELFDLEEDPEETRNLVEEEVALARSLEDELRELLNRESGPIEPSPVDTETRRKLEALGYTSAAAPEGGLADPKDRIDLYLALNDTTLESLEPGDDGFEDALALLERVLGNEPTVPRAYVLYGDLLLRTGRTSDAERNFEKLTEIEPDRFDGHYGLGVARARQGKFPEAKSAFERAIEL